MEGEAGEFHDWELLHNSSDSNSLNSSDSNSLNSSDSLANFIDLETFQPETHAMIQTDYFSLHSRENLLKSYLNSSDQGSVESDNPSWVDPETDSRFAGKEPREIWPDSGSDDRSEDFKFDEIEAKSDTGFVGNGKKLMGFEGIGEIGCGDKFSGAKNEIGDNSEVGVEISAVGENDDASMEVAKREKEKRGGVWWKVPLEILKFCAFRVSPVWTFSMAAAVMSVVILTRQLYKMKKKSQALRLKVTMDDKKVSQFMSRAARLNEAFSVVKRVPLIRPALPAAGGLTQWPVMSLR